MGTRYPTEMGITRYPESGMKAEMRMFFGSGAKGGDGHKPAPEPDLLPSLVVARAPVRSLEFRKWGIVDGGD